MTNQDYPAVVTAAGAATRFQPFTTTVPKEMLPLGSVPAVEHVIRECLAGGATDVIVVTRPGDTVIPAHVQGLRHEGMPVATVVENLAHGYGNAAPLLTLRDRLAACPAFAVAFGDDVLLNEPVPGANLTALRKKLGGDTEAAMAGQPINHSDTRSFGIIDTAGCDPEQVHGIRQRPAPETVWEPLAVVSRLVLRPSILTRLWPTELARGEVDLGVAVGQLAAEARVAVHRITGHWVTVGDPCHYVAALNTYWHHDPDKTGSPQS